MSSKSRKPNPSPANQNDNRAPRSSRPAVPSSTPAVAPAKAQVKAGVAPPRPPVTPSRVQQQSRRSAPAPRRNNTVLIAVIAAVVILGGLAALLILPGLSKPVSNGDANAPLAFDPNLPPIASLTPTTTEASEVIFPSQGGQHVSDAELKSFVYNSSPPTSGEHQEVFPASFVLDTPMEPKFSVHMLEHGNIEVFYNCACPDLVAQLKTFAAKYDDSSKYQPMPQYNLTAAQVAIESGDTVLVAPYPNMKQKIAIMAWRRMLNMDSFDVARADAFVTKYKRLGASIDNAAPQMTLPPQPQGPQP